MVSLRRTVEGWMGHSLYQELGDEPHTERVWGMLRDVVGQHLFSNDFVPVPFIESAAYYNQLFVFIKKPSILSTIGFCPPTYKVIGNMDYLVNKDVSTWNPQFDFSPWDVADGQSMYSDYNLRIMSNESESDVEKFIEFKAVWARARGAAPPIPGDVTIHRSLLEDLEGVNTLYVITDVVLASYVKLLVRIGNRTMNFIFDRDMPIGFIYKKYKLRNDGTFVAEMNTSLKVSESAAVWLQPLPQPIPTVPLWDYMRRPCNGVVTRRKLRSNLTIPTLNNETPNNTQQHPRDENALRLERPIENNDRVIRAREAIQMNNNFPRDIWENPARPQNQPVPARGSVSMETMRGSDDEMEIDE